MIIGLSAFPYFYGEASIKDYQVIDQNITTWKEDPEFRLLPVESKMEVCTNYFDKEIADSDFYKLNFNQQGAIRSNFLVLNGIKQGPIYKRQ
jgi:hypothetical protein